MHPSHTREDHQPDAMAADELTAADAVEPIGVAGDDAWIRLGEVAARLLGGAGPGRRAAGEADGAGERE